MFTISEDNKKAILTPMIASGIVTICMEIFSYFKYGDPLFDNKFMWLFLFTVLSYGASGFVAKNAMERLKLTHPTAVSIVTPMIASAIFTFGIHAFLSYKNKTQIFDEKFLWTWILTVISYGISGFFTPKFLPKVLSIA